MKKTTVYPCKIKSMFKICTPCGWQGLVLCPGVRPVLLRWESQVQDIGPPEISRLHVTSNGESSPRDLHLNTKAQLHTTTSKLQCWTPYAKQLARQEHTAPISREAA